MNLSDADSTELIQNLLRGLVTNSRIGDKPADFYYHPELQAQDFVKGLVDDLNYLPLDNDFDASK